MTIYYERIKFEIGNGVGSTNSKGLGHRRRAHSGNERVHWGDRVASAPSPHISYHATCYSYRRLGGNCVWEYLTTRWNSGIGLLLQETLGWKWSIQGVWSNPTWNLGLGTGAPGSCRCTGSTHIKKPWFSRCCSFLLTPPRSCGRKVKTRRAKRSLLQYILTTTC